jgi:hypothetical protein
VTSATDAPREEPTLVARWDLDKTYLRTDFDTVRDLVRTALERPDQKRTVPGAAALLRQLSRHGVETHILSGSPEQLRSRIIEKLRLDGVNYASLRLKPNLQNLLRLRFRALRGQLGYKLPALLLGRCELANQRVGTELLREVLLGDDAEADAFVYSLYADICRGEVDEQVLAEVLRQGGAYDDTIRDAQRFARYVEKGPVVERILIHLERQSSPSDFSVFGPRVVPFFNYLQAAFVLFEDGRLSPKGVFSVASDLVIVHNFQRAGLARSYVDLLRRGHVRGLRLDELARELEDSVIRPGNPAASDLCAMFEEIRGLVQKSGGGPTAVAHAGAPSTTERARIDYLALVKHHNPRHKKRKRPPD